jgi:hypothetical protein
MATVFRVLADNIERVQGLLLDAIPSIPADRNCTCSDALDPGSLPT